MPTHVKEIIEKLASNNMRDVCWAATCAGSVGEEQVEVLEALVKMLEVEATTMGMSVYERLAYARALTSAGHLMRGQAAALSSAVGRKAISLMRMYRDLNDYEIRHHANHALKLIGIDD